MPLLTPEQFQSRFKQALKCFERPPGFIPQQIPYGFPEFTCRIVNLRGEKLRENHPFLLSDNGREILSYIPPGAPMWTHRGIWHNYQPTIYRHWRDKPYTFAYICAPPQQPSRQMIPEILTGPVEWIYANICQPPTFDGQILLAVDLVLDVLIWPDGAWFVDDEAEFTEKRSTGELSDSDAQLALGAAAEITRLADSNDPLLLPPTPL